MLCSIIGRCEGRAAGLRSGLVGLVGTKRFRRFPGEEGCRASWGPGRGLQLGLLRPTSDLPKPRLSHGKWGDAHGEDRQLSGVGVHTRKVLYAFITEGFLCSFCDPTSHARTRPPQ